MSVGRIVGIVVVLVAAGLGVAFALGAFEEEAPPPTTSAAIGATSVAPSVSLVSTTLEPATSAGDNPLCIAYGEFQTATDGHLPVEGPDDLEIVRTASLAFYTEAVELVDDAAQGAFAEFVLYEQAVYDFYEAYEWNPSPPLEELVENPPPTAPAAATQTVVQVLEDQCGVVVVTE
jgi:hypothetical protein